MEGILALESGLQEVNSSYVLRVDCPWADCPKSLGLSSSACKKEYLCFSGMVDVRMNETAIK